MIEERWEKDGDLQRMVVSYYYVVSPLQPLRILLRSRQSIISLSTLIGPVYVAVEIYIPQHPIL